MSDTRQIVLDTETTGLETANDHRIIEIGCVEIVNRRPTGRTYHRYLNPDRRIDEGAIAVHGIRNEDLADQPRFPDLANEFLEFVRGAELIIHNAPFDVGFIEHELVRMKHKLPRLRDHCRVLDTLALAREMHPGQRNSLDALCRRYQVDNSGRDLHGALLDARLLADVYLLMTGGQGALSLDVDEAPRGDEPVSTRIRTARRGRLPVVAPTASELAAHEALMRRIDAASASGALWRERDFGG
jgi:DNA polymerase-3 subunit epsilon